MAKCYHCGDACKEETIVFDTKDFCCFGCKSVYQLLSTNNLCDYYTIEQQPGVKTEIQESSKFDYLSEAEIEKEILEFSNEHYASVSLYIPQIHCYSCLWLLEMFSKIHPGIKSAKVNYLKKELSITYIKSETSLKDVVIKLASIGYEPHIEKNNGESHRKRRLDKKLIYQLGVAAFVFGNTMFLSFPEYFAFENDIDPEISHYFGLINLFLATILLLFSARNYFVSAYQSLKFKKVNLDVPIAIGIVTIYFHGMYEVFTSTGIGYFDSLSGLIFFLLLGRLFQNKTFEQFNFERDYQSYFPLAARKKVGDSFTSVPLNHLKIGDTIIVQHEEIIPSDALLMSTEASIDYSFVTGESYPEKRIEKDQIQAGGRNKGGNIELMVTQLPSQSYLTKLWNQSSEQKVTPISQLSDKLGSQFTSRIIVLAIGASVFWYFKDPSQVLKVFTSILIVACPCALALAIPITYGNALRTLGNRRFYLKHANIIEYLAKITNIVFDKTGTLTKANDAKVVFHGQELSEEENNQLYAVLVHSTHALSKSVLSSLSTTQNIEVTNFREHKGLGIEALVDGKQIKLGSSQWIKGSESSGNTAEVHVLMDEVYRGYFSIQNQYRDDTQEMFTALSPEYNLAVLSGDNDAEFEVLKGLAPKAEVKFRQSPFDKKEYLKTLNDSGLQTMMIGDGLNDAGALMEAKIGVAVSENSANFTPASDAILEAKDITQLPLFLNYAKLSLWVVYACFGMSFMYNIVGLFFAVQGKLSPIVSAILMPLSSVSVLILSLGLSYLVERKVFGSKD